MPFNPLERITRNTRRLQEIAGTLAKYGLADWIPQESPQFLRDLFRSPGGEAVRDLSHEARIRLALTELGTTFIKLGQMMSTRADLVGPDLAEELEQLQADTPADPPETVRKIVAEELGASPGELFTEFDDTALASASIGQVHAARLPDGTRVIVKVRHEGIQKTVEEDLEILTFLAGRAERYSRDLRTYQPRATAEEFRRNLLRELDFRRELRNLQEFHRNFEDDPLVHIPRPFADLSSRRVLTMERLDGIKVSNEEALEEAAVDTADVCLRGANAWIKMIFEDGFYHADPHPGNILVLDGGVIGLLDTGSVGRLDDRTREEFEGLILGAIEGDADRLTEDIIRMGQAPQTLDRVALRTDIGEFVAELTGQALDGLDMGSLLGDLMAAIRRHGIHLRSNVALLLKTLVQLEGTSRSLDREFSLAAVLKPYYERAVRGRLAPDRIARRLRRAHRDWDRLLGILPRDLTDILSRVRDGSFDVHLQHRKLDAVVNRLVYGLLTAAVTVAAALMLSAKVPPAIWGISLPGVAAAVLGAGLGLKLLQAVSRSGGLIRRE